MLSNRFTVAVTVSDAKESAEWYRNKLDFEVSRQDEHWIIVWPKGAQWKLHLCEGQELEPGNTGIAFYSDDLQKTVEELKSKGVKFSMDYTKTDRGEEAKFDDPDGNVFWISKSEPWLFIEHF